MEETGNAVGLSTFFWKDKSLLNVLASCPEIGIAGLETWGMEPHFKYRDPRFISEVARQIKRLKIKPLSLHAPFRAEPSYEQYDISSMNEGPRREAVAQIKKAIEAYLRIEGERMVSLHPGGKLGRDEHGAAERYEQCERSLGELLTFCERHDVRLAVENLPAGWVGGSIGDVVRIISSLDSSRLGLCLDTSHAHLTDPGFGTVVADILKAPDRLFVIHASDNRGKKDEHLFPFDGTIRWKDLFASLGRMQCRGTLVLEVRNSPDVTKVMAAARSLAEMRADKSDEQTDSPSGTVVSSSVGEP